MNTRCFIPVRFVLSMVVALIFTNACSFQPYRPDPSLQPDIEQRAVVQQQGAITVRASVPSEDETDALFGAPLYARGIQPVWLRITNASEKKARFAPYSLDDEYFPPHEVAYVFRKRFSKQGAAQMESALHSTAMARHIQAGETVSGYVFTQKEPGTKAFNVDVHFLPSDVPNEHFTFFIEVPGFTPDHAAVDFDSLYTQEGIRDLSVDEFRAEWRALPCCSENRDGTARGRPLNVALVGSGLDVLRALLRSDWIESSLNKDRNYLNNIDYYFDRPPDAVFRKMRDEGSSRNEMTLWLSPYRLEGKPVWFGQVKHAITRLFDVGEYFFGVQLDPDADEGRNFLLQDLWYSQAVESYAFARTGTPVDSETPRMDWNRNPWFADGYSLVLWVAPEPVSLMTTRNRGWERLPGAAEARP